MNVYDIAVEGHSGDMVSLKEYEGKVLLIINSATECGFTPQYDELQDLQETFGKDDFMILDFPCDQFDHQAPGTYDEIVSFCDAKFGITFRIFPTIDVNGPNESPLFTYLKSQSEFKGFDQEHPLAAILDSKLRRENPDYDKNNDIKWNFTKFLVDRSGRVVERFEPTASMSYVEDRISDLI